MKPSPSWRFPRHYIQPPTTIPTLQTHISSLGPVSCPACLRFGVCSLHLADSNPIETGSLNLSLFPRLTRYYRTLSRCACRSSATRRSARDSPRSRSTHPLMNRSTSRLHCTTRFVGRGVRLLRPVWIRLPSFSPTRNATRTCRPRRPAADGDSPGPHRSPVQPEVPGGLSPRFGPLVSGDVPGQARPLYVTP